MTKAAAEQNLTPGVWTQPTSISSARVYSQNNGLLFIFASQWLLKEPTAQTLCSDQTTNPQISGSPPVGLGGHHNHLSCLFHRLTKNQHEIGKHSTYDISQSRHEKSTCGTCKQFLFLRSLYWSGKKHTQEHSLEPTAHSGTWHCFFQLQQHRSILDYYYRDCFLDVIFRIMLPPSRVYWTNWVNTLTPFYSCSCHSPRVGSLSYHLFSLLSFSTSHELCVCSLK